MYIIRTGLVKSVLTEQQYEMIKNDVIKPSEIKIEDTIRHYVREDGEEVEYLPFKITYKDVDKNGRDKFVFNENNKEFEQNFFSSSTIYAYGKELRILLELGVMSPVKVVFKEQYRDDKLYRTVICIQNQRHGKLALDA